MLLKRSSSSHSSNNNNNYNRSVLQGLQSIAVWSSLKLCDVIYMSVLKITMENNLNNAEKYTHKKG